MFHPLLILVLLTGPAPQTGSPSAPKVEDCFGRSLEGRDLVLVDWEGQIANTAARLDVLPPADARYPARIVVRSDQPRLYFDLPSTAGPDGPRKEIRLDRPEKTPVHVAIFPDRDALDEDHALEVEFVDAGGERRAMRIAIRVVDQDRDRPNSFRISVDFSQDKTGFFADETRRSAIARAAEDWAYFLDGAGLDPVPAGAEATAIWNPDGFNATRRVENARPYAGYLLYAYGIDGLQLRSGGEPSTLGGFQSRGGAPMPIRRSGGYEAEIKGNYNRKGWLAGLGESEWWRASNRRDTEADLESIAHHEIGHALIFNPANTLFGDSKRVEVLRDDGVRAYLGSDPAIDRADHLAGAVDPASLRGAFGNEYYGAMPNGRWLITKLDLLCARAVGHRLRETSPFAPLEMRTRTLPDGAVARPYSAFLHVSGGIPAYCWDVVAGALPDGLALDSFSGELRGIPRIAGTSEFTVRVRDSDRGGMARTLRLVLLISE